MSTIFLTREEVAMIVRVSKRTVRRWIKRGLLPELCIGGVRRIPESDLRKLLGLDSSEPLYLPDEEPGQRDDGSKW